MLRHLPNALTLANLYCGVAALLNLLLGNGLAELTGMHLNWTVVLMATGAVFDLLDGAVARAVGAAGPLGKQLDSLADAVTFGALPALLLANVVVNTHAYQFPDNTLQLLAAGAALLVAPFSALRLGRFNLDSRQTTGFIGLPTPANALLIGSLVLALESNRWGYALVPYLNGWWVLGFAVLDCWLLNSPLRLLALKFGGGFSLGKHWPQLVLLLGGAALVLVLGALAGPMLLLLYVGLSLAVVPQRDTPSRG